MVDVETTVFSRVLNKNYDSLKVKYPNINFTTSNREQIDPQFPTVYIHSLNTREVGSDLKGDNINGIDSAIQIEVTDNKSMENAQEVMNAVVKTMKEMLFRVAIFPEFDNTPDVYRKIARFSRVIGDGDTL